MTEATVRVMFVCLGNICRSPTAHGLFRHRVNEAGLADRIEIASSGTGDWHIGKPPDRRAAHAARGRQIDIDDLRAQQVTAEDLRYFDYVLAMDADNLASLQALYQTTEGARAEPSGFERIYPPSGPSAERAAELLARYDSYLDLAAELYQSQSLAGSRRTGAHPYVSSSNNITHGCNLIFCQHTTQ